MSYLAKCPCAVSCRGMACTGCETGWSHLVIPGVFIVRLCGRIKQESRVSEYFAGAFDIPTIVWCCAGCRGVHRAIDHESGLAVTLREKAAAAGSLVQQFSI